MILFLDDDPNRAALTYQRMTEEEKNKTIWCQTAQETIKTLWDYKETLEQVYLDHDLGGDIYVNIKREDCGMEVVRHLEKWANEPENFEPFLNINFTVHTWNEYAGNKMTERMSKLGLKVKYIPFGM